MLDYTNLFSPSDYETNDGIILKYFQKLKRLKNYIVFFAEIENPKISYVLEKKLALSIIGSKCKNEDEKIFKEEDSIEILKIFCLIENV